MEPTDLLASVHAVAHSGIKRGLFFLTVPVWRTANRFDGAASHSKRTARKL
jgi:hypothetical protein